MSKISDRELELLEDEDLCLPVERIKKKGKFVKQEKYSNKKRFKRQNQDWIYELDNKTIDEDFSES